MQATASILGDLVLVGGGHAQVAVLRQFAMRPLPGLRLTLVTNDLLTPYSGMLPGFVEGVWNEDDLHIDLGKLAQMADARLICSPVTGIDLENKHIHLKDRPSLRFDLLSINIGGQPDLDTISGARENVIPVKPISDFRHKFDRLRQSGLPERVAVIGGGAAGCELALALSQRWVQETGQRPQMSLFSRTPRLLPQMARRGSDLMRTALEAAAVKVHLGAEVTRIDKNALELADGAMHGFDACFLVSAVRGPGWVKETGLTLDDDGFVAVTPCLQSVSHPFVFAAGDIATVAGAARPKAGVFAVRAGPVLARNLRRYALGERCRAWKPQQRYLALLGTADGQAIAIRGASATKSRLWWWLKRYIDKRWMTRYQNLEMTIKEAKPRLAGLEDGQASSADPVFDTMRCLGCGAKTGHETLTAAMLDAIEMARGMGGSPDYLPEPGLSEDSAVLPALSGKMVQSVDVISQIVSDPYEFGRIAAVHALSDLYAANATPRYALAVITLSEARADLQQNQLGQILAGALVEFSAAGVMLVGGHTGEGSTLSVGFSITGQQDASPPPLDRSRVYNLVLTKPVGTGAIMAAHMRLKARAEWVQAATASMIASNGHAASLMAGACGAVWMTDITGFGIARHAANLADRVGGWGVTLWPDDIPRLPGLDQVLAMGITSSLHGQNKAAVRIDNAADFGSIELLFDPQTSGGLLGVIAQDKAPDLVNNLRAHNHQAAIVGQMSSAHTGFRLAVSGEA